MLELISFTHAVDFLRTARAFLEKEEALNSLMLGLAIRLVDQPQAYGQMPPYFAVVSDAEGPLLAALMTPPHNLLLYAAGAGEDALREEMGSPLQAVARDLQHGGWPVSGVMGLAPLATAFAAHWEMAAAAVSRLAMYQRLYKLEQVQHPRYSPGHLRIASEEDTDLIGQWLDAFHQEAVPNSPRSPRESTRLRVRAGDFVLWEDGGPVSMALKTRPTLHGISIGGVYTPPVLRRRGYATSCVAALSQRLLDAGFAYCTLFTDLSNPTSNAIYQQIGYRPLGDFREFKFAS